MAFTTSLRLLQFYVTVFSFAIVEVWSTGARVALVAFPNTYSKCNLGTGNGSDVGCEKFRQELRCPEALGQPCLSKEVAKLKPNSENFTKIYSQRTWPSAKDVVLTCDDNNLTVTITKLVYMMPKYVTDFCRVRAGDSCNNITEYECEVRNCDTSLPIFESLCNHTIHLGRYEYLEFVITKMQESCRMTPEGYCTVAAPRRSLDNYFKDCAVGFEVDTRCFKNNLCMAHWLEISYTCDYKAAKGKYSH